MHLGRTEDASRVPAFVDPFARRARVPIAQVNERRRVTAPGFVKIACMVSVAAALAVAATFRVDDAHWIVVARDSSYTISIDTTRIARDYSRTYRVWYRTDHAVTRFYKEKAFTRETVHAILRCEHYLFRVVEVAMSMGSGRPVARQITEPQDLVRQKWRSIEPGTIEADAARATCLVADWTTRDRR